MKGEIFVDWLTASEHHPQGGLPIVFSGLHSWYGRTGICLSERTLPESVGGSFDTTVRVGCNGSRVFISGNVGRFGRPDNLFNLGWPETWAAANRILQGIALPPLGVARGVPGDAEYRPGARVSRLDITANFGTGSDAQARAVIRWLGAQSISRLKRGMVGDESVWWANTQRMFKAYMKAPEMLKHGASADEFAVVWCRDKGVVRVEIELKRRLLADLGLDHVGAVSDAALLSVFKDQTELLRRVDRSDAPDLLASIPARYRMTCAAWLAGQDVRSMMSLRSFRYHAKALREYGIDIGQARNVEAFPLKVRVIELVPLAVPDWYEPLMRRA